jgi:hypothetical protein
VDGARVAATTELAPMTVVLKEGEVRLYRLVFGSFDSRQSADSTAVSLVQRGVVAEAPVVTLGGAGPTPR